MTPLLTQRCSLALLASLAMALAFGLVAVGPVVLVDLAAVPAASGARLGVIDLVNALCSLPLVAAATWGAVGVHRALGWPMAVRRPMAGFFGLSIGWSLLSALHHAAPSWAGALGIHVLVAASCTLLLLAFMAERFGLRFGSRRACAGAVVAAIAAGVSCWLQDGDARGLIWLQALPALLVASGLMAQPGLFTRRTDWVVMLLLYVVARSLDLVDRPIADATGGMIGGHALMHLLAAGVPAALALRVWQRVVGRDQPAPLSMSSRRATSLHTAG
jgi:hypothetical protein